MIDLHTNIIKAVENREKFCSIFLDFTKAFDTVNHDILLKKLKYYDIRIAQKWSFTLTIFSENVTKSARIQGGVWTIIGHIY